MDTSTEPDDFEREIALIRQQPELLAFLERRSKPARTYTLEQAREIFDLE